MVNVECRDCRKVYITLKELVEHFRQHHQHEFLDLINYIKEYEC